MFLSGVPHELWPRVLGKYSNLQYADKNLSQGEAMRRARSAVHAEEVMDTRSLFFKLGIDLEKLKRL